MPASGWAPQWLTLERGGSLVAACPLYLKSHSYGEFVFDWSWADAYRRHGLAYYPKGVVAAPFTPVQGSRLLAIDDAHRKLLVDALEQTARELGLSSLHLLFVDEADRAALAQAGWIARTSVQFHWQRDDDGGPADFAALLARMQRDKRKKIQQDRRRVADAGVTFTTHAGPEIDDGLWDFFYRCHEATYAVRGSTPYLTRDFFARVAAAMPELWVLFVARRAGAPVGCSLIAVDGAQGLAWGRYWGATSYVPCLHFEACYYQPLQWCIANGYRRFEGGAQGEHKMARGLMPTETASAHWVADARFRDAIRQAMQAERDSVDRYVDELREHSPFKG